MGERLARQAGEDLEQSQARRRREEEVEKAKLEALEMQWYCSSHTLYIRLVQHRTNYFLLSSLLCRKEKMEREMERLAERYRQHGEVSYSYNIEQT